MTTRKPKAVLQGPVETQEPLLIHDLPTDNIVATITALAGELFVVKDRLAAMELELERAGAIKESALEQQQLSNEEQGRRQAELAGFVQRVLSELTRDRSTSSEVREQVHEYLSPYGAKHDS